VQQTFHLGGVVPNAGAPSEPAPPAPPATVLFAGVPALANGEVVLFDSARPRDAARVQDAGTIRRLVVRFAAQAPSPDRLGTELSLLVFVDDLAAPRATVRLADLVRQRGERPLNVRRGQGEALRVVLVDPAGVWAGGAPSIEVALEW
jgi:Ca-activated chloride channel family protein